MHVPVYVDHVHVVYAYLLRLEIAIWMLSFRVSVKIKNNYFHTNKIGIYIFTKT